MKAKKLLSLLLMAATLLTMLPAISMPAYAAPVDTTRYKDVVVNIDSTILDALGLSSATNLANLLEQYLLAQGFSAGGTQIRSNVTTIIDTTDLTNWYVYDHYENDNYWNISANWTQYGGATTQADAWRNLYGRATNDIMRPQFLYTDTYHTDPVYGVTTPPAYNYTLEQMVNFSINDAQLINNLYYNKRLREHIYSYKDATGSAGMWFSGYGQPGYVDFLFYPTDSPDTKNIKFSVESQYANTHSMNGAGFLINTGIYTTGTPGEYNATNTYISGYILYFTLTGSGSTARATSVSLLPINANTLVNSFHDLSTAWPVGTALASANFAASSEWFSKMDIEVNITETGVEVYVEQSDNTPGATNLKLSYQEPSGSGTFSTGYQGFGPLVRYGAHGCNWGSAFKFSDLEMSFVTDAFESILTGSNSDFRNGNDVDRFFVNLVSTPVNDASPDYWDGIDDLRGSKTFYITHNTDNTVVENKPGGQTFPEPHNLTNGISGYYNNSGPSDITGWPRYDSSGNIIGYWDPASIPSASQAQALADLVKWMGDYIAVTTTDDWVRPRIQSQNPKPIVDAEFTGTPVDGTGSPTGLPAPLSAQEPQRFTINPIKVSIQNNFDNTDSSHPYVASGETIAQFEISWAYQPPGANYQVDMNTDPRFNVAPEIIYINPADPGGTLYALQNFTFEPGIISNVSSWPLGEYIAEIIAVGSNGIKSAPVYIAISLVASSEKDITAFSILGQVGTTTISGTAITLTVPYGTDVTTLTPNITVSAGASVSPASGAAQNFTGPVTYRVTAADASFKDYTVTVTVAPSSEKDITAFSIPGQVGTTTIGANTITLTVPYGTDATNLTPTITVSASASVNPASGAAQDFTNPVTYRVTAADTSFKDYIVTVTVALVHAHSWTSNNDGTHDCTGATLPCGVTNETCSPNTPGATCAKCGYLTPAPSPVHAHNWVSNNDGTHDCTGTTLPCGVTNETCSPNTPGANCAKCSYLTPALSSDASLLAVAGQPITAGGEAGTAAAPKSAGISVANSVSSVADADLTAAAGAAAALYSGAGYAARQNPVGLNAGANHLYITVTAQDGTALHYDITVTRQSAPSGSTPYSSSNNNSDNSSVAYTVAFDSNGGSAVPSQSVPSGGKAVKPADPAKAGFDFAGWHTDAASATAYDFAKTVTANLTLYAKWEKTEAKAQEKAEEETEAPLPFEDVKSSDWFCDAVRYVYAQNLMIGTADDTFAPDIELSRAMMVTILYRLAGEPGVAGFENPFDDVEQGMWYTDAVKWGAKHGVVLGYGDGNFGPGDPVTKEQVAALIYRAQQAGGKIPHSVPADSKVFADADEISGWAQESVNALNEQGLFKDIPGSSFNPQKPAERSEIASILYRWLTALD